jgi:hypothetical protein
MQNDEHPDWSGESVWIAGKYRFSASAQKADF